MDRYALQDYFVSLGEKAFHARQLLQWVYQRGVTDFSEMTDLRLSLRQTLSENAAIELPEVSRLSIRRTAHANGCSVCQMETPSRRCLFPRKTGGRYASPRKQGVC